MHVLRLVVASFALLFLAPAHAQQSPPTTVDQFLTRWQAMQAMADKGEKMAEGARLVQSVGEILGRYRSELKADQAAGKPPRACPGKGDRFDFQLLVTAFQALPAGERQGSLDTAVYGFFDKRYPCPVAALPPHPGIAA